MLETRSLRRRPRKNDYERRKRSESRLKRRPRHVQRLKQQLRARVKVKTARKN